MDVFWFCFIEERTVGHYITATRGAIVKAFISLRPGYEPCESLKIELQEFVKQRLAKHEYPREIEFISEIPKTTTGKIRRMDLRKREGID